MRLERQACELCDHEIDDVVGVGLVPDAVDIPGPFRLRVIEGQQSLVGKEVEKLKHEKRIAGSLLMQQLRERRGAKRFTAYRVRDQLPEMFAVERPELDLRYPGAAALDGGEPLRQRMVDVDLVVAICADQHSVRRTSA